MVQNTNRIDRGKLTIKWGEHYTPRPLEFTKLERSLALAIDMAKTSAQVLKDIVPRIPMSLVPMNRPIIGSRRPEMRDDVQDLFIHRTRTVNLASISYHFGLPLPFDEPSASQWPQPMARVRSTYDAILSGLQKHVTIADAHSTIIGKAIARGERNLDDPEAYFGGKDKGKREAADVRGIVYPRKAFMARLPIEEADKRDHMRFDRGQLVPHLDITPEDYGSIHINFHELLKRDKQVSDLSVARTIVHEASHKFANTQDYCYAHSRETYQAVRTSQKVWNADCYAFCAVSLYKGVLVEDDDGMPAG